MSKVDFNYNDNKFIIQCNDNDQMKDIIKKFLNKCNANKKHLYFLYNGQIINGELTLSKCANSLDRSRNYMNVLVIEGQGSYDDSNKLIKSDYVICPQCNENAIMSIEDFKITIYCFKNGHKTENLQINEFGKTQYIDQSKIKCDICGDVKSESNETKFFTCYECKHNLCSNCRYKHDESHNNIINFEEKQFYCEFHSNKLKYFCNECKKDLCDLCKGEHENHDIIGYDNIILNIDNIRNNELKDTKEKIYHMKTVINRMINHLNKLNKNLDTYFEIYNNLISNFNKDKINYSLIQNIKNIKTYNNNFIGNITEIINDNNLKSQFVSIINMQLKMEFKKNSDNKENDEKNKTENNCKDIYKNEYNYTPENDSYENFSLNQIKELQTFKTNNKIEKIIVLNDGRILTIQKYCNEEGKKLYKLCVYSILNEFVCDINIDIENINDIFKMDDGNVILYTNSNLIKIIKVRKNDIEEILKIEEIKEIKRLLNNYFYIYKMEETEEKIQSAFFAKGKSLTVYEHKYYIYLYTNGQFINDKNITEIVKKTSLNLNNICQTNENELVIFSREKTKLFGDYDYLLFYNTKNNEILKKLKIGKKNEYFWDKNDMFYIGGDDLILQRDSISGPKFILVDTKNRNIKNEFNYEISVNNCIYLNEKLFLSNYYGDLILFEFENSKSIILKEKRELHCILALKYPGNRIITTNEQKISLYG